MKHLIHSFTLILAGVDENTPHLEDKLFAAKCDDALINFRNGTVYLDFDRECESFDKAVISAIKDVEGAKLRARVIRVAPDDYVSESEIAKRLHRKRQTISLWVKGERRAKNPFPNPVMKLTGKSPLWRWYEVVKWLYQQQQIRDFQLVENAKFIQALNSVLISRDAAVRKYQQKLLRRLQ